MPDSARPGKSTKASGEGAPKPAIRFSGVRKEYRLYEGLSDQALDVLGLSWARFWRPVRYRTFVALDGIDLEIGHGERVGIVGRNGAGKTTMLKLVTGNFAPTAGEIEIDGTVQALMQTGLGFHGEFTGMENIRSSLVYNGLTGSDLEEAVEDIVEFCELGDFIDQPVKTYSLGMRARLQFAAATAIKPDIVIIDEVLGAGDAYFSGKSNERIKRLAAQGATLLIVSHSMAQILQFSDRAVWIDKGRIIASGASLEIVNRYEEYIHKLEDTKRHEKSGEDPGASADLGEIPQWILDKSTMSPQGADWGGSGPLRIRQLGLLDANGKPSKAIESNAPFGLFADIESDEAGEFQCSCVFVIYDEQGDVVTRLAEPQRPYDEKMCRVVAWVHDNPIGKGSYTVSGGLFRDYRLEAPAEAHRYHILSRGLQFRIRSKRRDSCRIYLDASWQPDANS